MQTPKILTLLLLCSVLIGCGQETVVETVEPELRPISTEIVWDGLSLETITPVTAVEASDSEINIFPYNNNDAHITVRRILISNNGFWNAAISTYKDSENFRSTAKYSYVTLADATTYGYLPIDEEYAYIVFSSDLPSSYVELVLDVLCNSNI